MQTLSSAVSYILAESMCVCACQHDHADVNVFNADRTFLCSLGILARLFSKKSSRYCHSHGVVVGGVVVVVRKF